MAAVRLQTGFRRRLTIAFVVVVAVSGGVVALTSFVLVRAYRTRVFTEQSIDKASLSLISAPEDLTVADVDDLMAEFQRRGGFETVVIAGDVVFSSVSGLGQEEIPDGMVTAVRPGELIERSATIDGDANLVVGGETSTGGLKLFFFFPKQELLESVEDFRDVLALGWLTSVAGAALFGNLVARRTLRPVHQAAQASESLAEGLLDTRLETSSDDEFGRWANSFNRMAEALEEKIRDLSLAAERERRLTADVAHELQTPLAGMLSAASLVEDELSSLPPDAAPFAHLLVEDVHRLRALVTELLELARLDAGQEEAHLEALSLGQALRTVIRPWGVTTSVSLQVDDDVMVVADRARFKRVVGNLLSNAVEHGDGGVEVRGYQEGEQVVIEVCNRGSGIDEIDLSRVFDRFYKSDRSRSAPGSGLGLSIALANARLQGGSLSARKLEGGVACFTFTLRAATGGDGATASSEARTVPLTSGG